MPPKPDPYATPLQRRIGALLLIVTFVILAILLSHSAQATTFTWDGNLGGTPTGNSKWSLAANWNPDGAPPISGLTTTDIIFAGITKLTPAMDGFYIIHSLSFASGAGPFNLTSSNGTETLTIGTGGITNSSSNVQTITSALILGAAQTWNGGSFGLNINSPTVSLGAFVLSINGTGTNTINSIISSTTAGNGLTKNGTGLLILSKANTYTGNTTINAGELFLTATGSLASGSTILLGDTIANSPSAMLTFGSTSGGNTLSNAMTVRASASGTTGTRTILGLATSGNTNTYSGAITMNAGLTLQSAAVGSTVANGQGILLLQGGSVNVGTSTLSVNSNLRGNNADTYSIQGIVRINEAVTSSLATGGSIFKDGSGSLILQGTSNTYTGTDATALNPNGTRIGGGILGIFGDGSLGLAPATATNNVFFTTSAVPLNGDSIAPTLRADANNITLAATRNINIASGVTGRIDSNGNTMTVNGVINGAGNLAKIGTGSLVLTNTNTFTGTTTIAANGGTLNAGAAGSLGSTSSITVNSGGTLLLSNSGTNDRIRNAAPMTLNAQGSATVAFNTAGLSEHGVTNNTAGIGALTLQSSSIIDMGNVASIIAFANSAAQAPNWSGTLSIYNWSGNPGTGNGTDQLFFGNNPGGLLPTQLAEFQFYSGPGTGAFAPGAVILLSGEVVPVPEPSTWLGAALALGSVAYTQRRRFARLVRRTA